MNEQSLRDELNRMAALPGMQGCALVEVSGGMVWYAAGRSLEMQNIAEAASDYWRLYQRLHRNFTQLGNMKAAVFMHVDGRITLMPCGKDMLLVALTHEATPVDWAQWQTQAKELALRVNQL